MNKKKIFQILVLIILFAWFAVYFYQNIDEFRQLRIVNAWYLIPMILFSIVASVNNGLILKFFLLPFGVLLKFKEYFGLVIINSMTNYLTPLRGGIAVKAIYLKKRHQLSYTHFLSMFAGMNIVMFLVTSFVGIVTVLLFRYIYGIFNALVFSIFLLLFLLLLGVMMFSPKIKETKYRLINIFINVLNGWHLVKHHKRAIFFTGFIAFINIAIMTFGMFFSFRVFGIEIALLQVLFLSVMAGLSLLISITPGGLGITETIVAFTAVVIQMPVSEVLAVSILSRFINLGLLFILGPIFSYILMNQKNDKNEENNIL